MSWKLRLALAAALSLAAHLYGIRSPVTDYHHHRQANTAAIARNYRANGLRFLHPQIDWNGPDAGRAATEFPLYMYLVGLLWPLFGLGELWGRLLSAGCSAATACVLVVFLARWLGERAALFGALLFSLLPVEVYFGRTVQPEALALLATAGAFWAFDLHLESGRARTWLAAALCAALAIGLKIPYGYLLGVCLALAWARKGRAGLREPAVLAFVPAALVPVAAWYLYAKAGAYVVPTESGQFLKLLGYERLPYFMFFQLFSRFPELTTTWPGMGLWAAGAWALAARPEPVRRFLWAWFGCVVFYAVAGGRYVHSHEYTALPFALVNAAFLGLGLERLIDRARALPPPRRGWGAAALAILVCAMPAYTAVRIGHWYRVKDRFLTRAAEPVDRISAPGDLFLCNERAESLLLFYIRRKGWSADIKERNEPALEWIARHRDQGARFFITRRAGEFSDRGNALVKPVYDSYPLAYEDPDLLIFSLK